MNPVSAILITLVVMGGASGAAGDPALPGDHSLTQSQAGDLLISELRCAACHSGVQQDSLPARSAPDLTEVGARIAPDYLRRFLASPSTTHPGTTMPDLLAARTDVERDNIAEALTHFLIARSTTPFHGDFTGDVDVQRGAALFHVVGCVACHGPKEALPDSPPVSQRDEESDDEEPAHRATKRFRPIAVNLGHVAAKYSVESLSAFLFQPLQVRQSGRMPDMKLTPAESLAIAGYLVGNPPQDRAALQPQALLVAKGREYFQELRCAACHSLPDMPAVPVTGSLGVADLARGCLSPTHDRGPRFHLESAQVEAIIASLQQVPDSDADADDVVVAKTLTAFRCIACHVRDDFGGIPEAYNAYFAGSEVKMGDDGRIPPPLTLVGAKLQPVWMKKVLFDGESVRPYMATRMPQYGAANLQHLPEVLARLDVIAGREMSIPSPESRTDEEREREKLLRAAGRELLGDQGLNCIACHNFNGKAAPVNQGIDLLTTYPRLQPAWFDAYVRNPGAFRPRTIMPSAWPNGVASHKTILEGNADQQIEAIWYYLSLGTSAADPPGIRGVSTRLTVDTVARIHRGRSRVAGFRGIAVGLPEKLSYAFNAETGTLSAIWSGDFIGVNWNGQGSGDFNPASEPVTLAQDVSFAPLEDENAVWPLMPVMTREAKVNNDPLYPKNVGYQFRGYYLDEASIPTFMYRVGTIEIEDRMAAAESSESPGLRRVLRLTSPVSRTIWFRALTGEIHAESAGVFQTSRLRLTLPETETRLRTLTDDPGRSELLLRLNLPRGESTWEFLYEPIH